MLLAKLHRSLNGAAYIRKIQLKHCINSNVHVYAYAQTHTSHKVVGIGGTADHQEIYIITRCNIQINNDKKSLNDVTLVPNMVFAVLYL